MDKNTDKSSSKSGWNKQVEDDYLYVMGMAEPDSTAGVEPGEGDEVEQR